MCIITATMVKLSVNIGKKLQLDNPVMVASGTFGCGEEFQDIVDINKFGAIVTKTITSSSRKGNPMPRTVETSSGLLNSIGLQNQGINNFIKHKIPFLSTLRARIIVSIAGESVKEFSQLAQAITAHSVIDGIELNISCPNVKDKTRLIAQDAKATYKLVAAVRKATKQTLITKLSPNVTDIAEIAGAASDAGTDAVSLINTVYGMKIDANRQKSYLASGVGGLSGPAIKPIALAAVYKVARKVKIPVIGTGGIMNASDALEFILAGATAVAVGTANFINPKAGIEIINGIEDYLLKHKIKDVKHLVGALKI